MRRGQASPDFAMSAMIFSLAVLFIFFHLSRTYYSRVWEGVSVGKNAQAQNLALFLISEPGSWSANPFQSDSIAFGGKSVNRTRMAYFFGMSHQNLERKLGVPGELYAEAWLLPSITIVSDASDIYMNSSVKVNFQTSENATLYVVLVGIQENTTTRGYSYFNKSLGRYHTIRWSLPWGVYSLKALAISDPSDSSVGHEKYGVYETSFRVVAS